MRMIIQDDGKLGLFCNITGAITAIDCTEEEMIEIWKEEAIKKAEREMKNWIDGVKTNRYNSMTLQEALENHIVHNHDKDFERIIAQKKNVVSKK